MRKKTLIILVLGVIIIINLSNINVKSIKTQTTNDAKNTSNLLSEWDWRNTEHNGIKGDWTTPIKSQGFCGCCSIFALCAAFESAISINENDPEMNIDLSEQYMLSCSSAKCTGWDLHQAQLWLKTGGAIPEECLPYKADDTIPCSSICNEWKNKRINVKNIDRLAGTTEEIKNLLIQKGPLATRMKIYPDFDKYTNGVYVNKEPSDYYSTHVVTIVGYKDTPYNMNYDGYWICKNSWGNYWGENGYFRIAYEEADIGFIVYYIEYEQGSIPVLFVDAQNNIKKYAKTDSEISFYGIAGGGTQPYSWHWDFDDGTTSTKRNPTHKYQESREYSVKLTVTDADGETSTDTDKILIDNPPKKPTITGPKFGNTGQDYTYTISTEDEDGDNVAYTICWGHDLPIDLDEYYRSGEKIILNHTWNNKGSFCIQTSSTDEHGVVSSNSFYTVYISKNKILPKRISPSFSGLIITRSLLLINF